MKDTYKKLFSYIPDKKYLAITAITFSILSAILTIIGYYYIYKFLDTVIVEKNYMGGEEFAICVTLFLLLGAISYLISGYYSHLFGFRLETNLRKRGIDGLSKASFKFFDTHNSGIIRKTIDDNASKTHSAVAHLIPDLAKAFLVPILALILGFFVSVKVGAVLIVTTIIGFYFFSKMFSENDFMEKYQKSLEELSGETVEYIRNMQVIKIFNADINSFKKLKNAIENYSDLAYKYSLKCKGFYVPYQFVFLAIMAIVIIPISLTKPMWEGSNTFPVSLIMIFFLSGVVFSSMNKIMYAAQDLYNAYFAISALEKTYAEMLDEGIDFGSETLTSNKDIEFKDVTFGYGETNIFNKLNLKFEDGKSYALTGKSGSGKSTLAKLISGFYRIGDGEIRLGDKKLSDYTKETITKNISFIFQNTKLFKKSIYENVLLAKKDATREEVLRALELARCGPILDKFPERENTIIGSKGVYLSIGEKQRIAIARVILKDSPILIMDEASASLDADNEFELLTAFKNLMKGRTVIMIAHRLTSLNSSQEILVVENGKVIEQGKEDELLKKDSYYKNLKELYNVANDWRVER